MHDPIYIATIDGNGIIPDDDTTGNGTWNSPIIDSPAVGSAYRVELRSLTEGDTDEIAHADDLDEFTLTWFLVNASP